MKTSVPIGSEVTPGEMYRCTNCGYEIDTLSIDRLPQCPDCRSRDGWELLTDEGDDWAEERSA